MGCSPAPSSGPRSTAARVSTLFVVHHFIEDRRCEPLWAKLLRSILAQSYLRIRFLGWLVKKKKKTQTPPAKREPNQMGMSVPVMQQRSGAHGEMPPCDLLTVDGFRFFLDSG